MEETTHSNFSKFRKFQQPVVTLEDEIKKLSDVETNVELVELIDDKKLHPSIKSFLISLKKNLNKKFKRNTNKPFKAHYDYLYLLTKTKF